MRILPGPVLAVLVGCVAAPAFAASTAFRLVDLDLRDPHFYAYLIGCHDFTNVALAGSSFNGSLQSRIQGDGEPDGLLDLSLLVVFDPLDPASPVAPLRFGESSCTAPMAGTTCGPAPYENLQPLGATNAPTGPCLAPLAGTTTSMYTPSITTPSGPCFASPATTLSLPLFAGVPVTLRSARIAATYGAGSPPATLVNGLLMGFLTEADAAATILPASMPLIGGQSLAALLRGGTGNCASGSDLDTGPSGESGWWMYFNFVAQAVSYTGPSLSVGPAGDARLSLGSRNPGGPGMTVSFELDADGPASLAVYDLGGRRVAVLADGWQSKGVHRAAWDGRLDRGGAAAPGLYVIRLANARGTVLRKVALLR